MQGGFNPMEFGCGGFSPMELGCGGVSPTQWGSGGSTLWNWGAERFSPMELGCGGSVPRQWGSGDSAPQPWVAGAGPVQHSLSHVAVIAFVGAAPPAPRTPTGVRSSAPGCGTGKGGPRRGGEGNPPSGVGKLGHGTPKPLWDPKPWRGGDESGAGAPRGRNGSEAGFGAPHGDGGTCLSVCPLAKGQRGNEATG